MKNVYWDIVNKCWEVRVKRKGKNYYGGRNRCKLMANILAARLREELTV